MYYEPRPVSEEDLALTCVIDKLHLEYPFAGARMLRDLLNLMDIRIGRRRVRTLMRRMGIEALYRKPNTGGKHPQHQIYPYLLRHLKVARPNQVWAMDITYIPMARGFIYFTSLAFTDLLKQHGIRISIDGKGCWRDNIFVERLWRTIKYEEVYLRAYETVSQAKASLGRYLDFYNTRRLHSRLDRMPTGPGLLQRTAATAVNPTR